MFTVAPSVKLVQFPINKNRPKRNQWNDVTSHCVCVLVNDLKDEERRTNDAQWRDTCDYNWFFLNDFQFVLNSFSINHKRGSHTFVWRKKAAVTAKVFNSIRDGSLFFFFLVSFSIRHLSFKKRSVDNLTFSKKYYPNWKYNEIGRFCLSTSSCIVLVLWLWLCMIIGQSQKSLKIPSSLGVGKVFVRTFHQISRKLVSMTIYMWMRSSE